MRNNILQIKITRIIRYIFCFPLIVLLGFITLPLTLIFKWNGFWILFIMNEESCSAEKAKILLQNDPKYQIRRTSFQLQNEHSDTASTLNINSSSGDTDYLDEQQASPAYSYLNYNIFHNSHHY
jgi:hypothetical protein